jgi:CRISPR-associated protein Cmr5
MNAIANSKKQTIEQRRAHWAYSFATDDSAVKAKKDEIGRLAKQLPARIMTAGLGHALAFTKEKGGEILVDGLSKWLAKRIPSNGKDDLICRIKDGDAAFLRRATDETLAILIWINRFFEANAKE